MIISEDMEIKFSLFGLHGETEQETHAAIADTLEFLAKQIRCGTVPRAVSNPRSGATCGTVNVRIIADSVKDIRA